MKSARTESIFQPNFSWAWWVMGIRHWAMVVGMASNGCVGSRQCQGLLMRRYLSGHLSPGMDNDKLDSLIVTESKRRIHHMLSGMACMLWWLTNRHHWSMTCSCKLISKSTHSEYLWILTQYRINKNIWKSRKIRHKVKNLFSPSIDYWYIIDWILTQCCKIWMSSKHPLHTHSSWRVLRSNMNSDFQLDG